MCEEESGIPCLKWVAPAVEAEWRTKSHESLENFGGESNCFLTTEKAFQINSETEEEEGNRE